MEPNFDLFFKTSKNIFRETESQIVLGTKKEEKYKSMSVHTFNAIQEIKKQNLLSEAKEQGTIEELEEFYLKNFDDNKNRLHKEIKFKRLYEEIRKL